MSAPTPWSADSTPFSRVSVRGSYDASQMFYVDNRVYRGQPGVQVIQAFESTSGRRLLVDRGWMSFPDRQSQPPPPPSPADEVEIIGLLLPDFGVGFSLESRRLDPRESLRPLRIQQLDLKFIGELADTESQYQLRLRNAEPGALTTQPFALPMGSERHLAYAVQWFGLALAAIIIWLFLVRRHLSRRSKSDG